MASSQTRSSSLCQSEMSLASRTSRLAMSQSCDPFARVQRGSTSSANSGNLKDMLAALKQQSGQFRTNASSQAAALEQEFNQLRSAGKYQDVAKKSLSQTMPSEVTDLPKKSLSQTVPTEGKPASPTAATPTPANPIKLTAKESSGVGARARQQIKEYKESLDKSATVGLQDLVERELKAQQAANPDASGSLESTRIRRHTVTGGYRSQSVHAPSRSLGHSMFSTLPTKIVESPRGTQVAELHKELDKLDHDLEQSRQDNRRLTDEKAASDRSVASHQRDIAALEHMLESVMTENNALRIALTEAHKGQASKLTPMKVAAVVERNMVNQLILSGISSQSLTPHSNGSASTETPPLERDAEDLDLSRTSIASGIRFSDRNAYPASAR